MTPLEHFGEVYLKREDQNITGSAKDRAIQLQVNNAVKLGFKSAVISSTGNAAISATYFCRQGGIPLTVFVSPNIAENKLNLINGPVTKSLKPISEAFKYSLKNNSYFLRQSTDPLALTGYGQISQELIIQLPKITSIFIPVGSGTTLYGIAGELPPTVKLFAVQPASHNPIASTFNSDYQIETKTITDALSVKLLPLKSAVIDAIHKSGGSGITVQNDSVQEHFQKLNSANILLSPESALAYAGFAKTLNTKLAGDYPVILCTGAQR
jgi:threonine synthase